VVGLGEVGYWLLRWSLVSASMLEAPSSPEMEFQSNSVVALSEKLNYQDFYNWIKYFNRRMWRYFFRGGKVMSVLFHLCRTLPVSYNRKNCRKKKSGRSITQNPRDTQSMKIAITQKMEVRFC